MDEMAAWVHYREHQRQVQLVNDEAWKHERPRRALRVAMAKTLLALARRIAPPTPEMERAKDALAQ